MGDRSRHHVAFSTQRELGPDCHRVAEVAVARHHHPFFAITLELADHARNCALSYLNDASLLTATRIGGTTREQNGVTMHHAFERSWRDK